MDTNPKEPEKMLSSSPEFHPDTGSRPFTPSPQYIPYVPQPDPSPYLYNGYYHPWVANVYNLPMDVTITDISNLIHDAFENEDEKDSDKENLQQSLDFQLYSNANQCWSLIRFADYDILKKVMDKLNGFQLRNQTIHCTVINQPPPPLPTPYPYMMYPYRSEQQPRLSSEEVDSNTNVQPVHRNASFIPPNMYGGYPYTNVPGPFYNYQWYSNGNQQHRWNYGHKGSTYHRFERRNSTRKQNKPQEVKEVPVAEPRESTEQLIIFDPEKYTDVKHLFIGNVPFNSTFENLWSYFNTSTTGKKHLKSLEMQRQPNGSFKGFAIGITDSLEDSISLIKEFNGSVFEGRDLIVRFDKLPEKIPRNHQKVRRQQVDTI